MVNKVLLIMSPVETSIKWLDINPLPPMGLAYLAAILLKHNVEVKIVDCLGEGWNEREDLGNGRIRIGLSNQEILTIIETFKPDIVGVNSMFSRQSKYAHSIYKMAKSVSRNIITIAGGAHPTVLPQMVLSDPNVDFVVMGEGEQSIVELINYINGNINIECLDGVGYKDNNQIIIRPKTRYIHDLNSLPFPARHLIPMEKYWGLRASHGLRHRDRFSPIITSRGCPAGCTFCSAYNVWGRGFRARSPENVIAEMKILKEKYHIEEIMFEDDNVTLDPERAERIFDLMIQNKFNFVWDTPNGVAAWTLSETLIKKMKDSGCIQLNFAIETGNQFVMDNIIHKPVKLKKVKPLIEYARKIGLDVLIFLVIGMPGETCAQMWDSFRFARAVKIFAPFISVATPYPGTKLYNICKENGFIPDHLSMEELYIRSYIIKTPEWDKEALENILCKGQSYLRRAFRSYVYQKSQLENRRIVVFGTGSVAKRVLNYGRYKKYVYCFLDNNPEKANQKFYDKPIYTPANLLKETDMKVLVIIASSFYQEISTQLSSMGLQKNVDYLNASFY